MTEDAARALCVGAGLTVQAVVTVGRMVGVTVAPYRVSTETVVKRLGVTVTVSFGSGSGNVTLWFMSKRD